MFTGLVEEKGKLAGRVGGGVGARLSLRCAMAPLVLGESVAIDGACLTVDAIVAGGFEAEASAETLERTTLGALPIGSSVNLERAVPLGGRMGGHIVAGHVDGVGTLAEKRPTGKALIVVVAYPPSLAAFIAEKGSIAVNGVSLTVNGTHGHRFDVVLVPHTRGATSLDTLPLGAKVNLEVDVLARYVARQLAVAASPAMGAVGPIHLAPGHDERSASRTANPAQGEQAWLDRLSRNGYL